MFSSPSPRTLSPTARKSREESRPSQSWRSRTESSSTYRKCMTFWFRPNKGFSALPVTTPTTLSLTRRNRKLLCKTPSARTWSKAVWRPFTFSLRTSTFTWTLSRGSSSPVTQKDSSWISRKFPWNSSLPPMRKWLDLWKPASKTTKTRTWFFSAKTSATISSTWKSLSTSFPK